MKEGISGQRMAITPAAEQDARNRTWNLSHPDKWTDSRPLLRFFRDEGNQSRTASRNKGKSTAEL